MLTNKQFSLLELSYGCAQSGPYFVASIVWPVLEYTVEYANLAGGSAKGMPWKRKDFLLRKPTKVLPEEEILISLAAEATALLGVLLWLDCVHRTGNTLPGPALANLSPLLETCTVWPLAMCHY